MICNLSLAFQKSRALRSMPRLKVAPRESTGGASEPLFMHGEGSKGRATPENILNEPLKMKF